MLYDDSAETTLRRRTSWFPTTTMALKLWMPPAGEPLLVLFTSTSLKEYVCLATLIAALPSSSVIGDPPVSSLPESSRCSMCLQSEYLCL